MLEKPRSNKAKSFNRFSGKQDHGVAAMKHSHWNPEPWYDREKKAKLLEAKAPPVLEEHADAILEAADDAEPSLSSSNKQVSRSGTLTTLLSEYELLYPRYVGSANKLIQNRDDDQLETYVKAISDRLEVIEAELRDLVRAEETVPDVNEVGRKSENQRNKAYLKAATADYSPEDEVEDFDGDSHIRITTKSPFSK